MSNTWANALSWHSEMARGLPNWAAWNTVTDMGEGNIYQPHVCIHPILSLASAVSGHKLELGCYVWSRRWRMASSLVRVRSKLRRTNSASLPLASNPTQKAYSHILTIVSTHLPVFCLSRIIWKEFMGLIVASTSHALPLILSLSLPDINPSAASLTTQQKSSLPNPSPSMYV